MSCDLVSRKGARPCPENRVTGLMLAARPPSDNRRGAMEFVPWSIAWLVRG
jgi:hypothetical protein